MPKSKKENIEEITFDPIEEKVKEPAPVEEPIEEPVEPETIEEGEDITEPDAPIEPEFEEPEEGEQGEDVEFDEEAGDEETDEDAPEEDAPPFLGLMLGAKNAPVSEDPDPQSRIEALLWHIINGTTTEAEPQSRNEAILTAIAYSGTYTEEAQSRIEALLIAILNHEEVDITPISRNEAILKAIANSGEYDEEPQSRNEELLLKWLEAWGIVIDTVSGAIANFTTSVVKPLVNLKAYFKATQEAGTPTPQSPKAISGVSAVSVVHCHKNLYQYDENLIAQGKTSTQTTRAYYNLGLRGCTLAFSGSYKSGVTPDNTRLNIGKLNNGILTIINDFIYEGSVNDRVATFGADDTAVIMYTAESTTNFKTAIEKFDLQLEIGSQVTTYEAYNGSTTLINLGGTYYGGYVEQDKDGHRQFTNNFSSLVNLNSFDWYKTTIGGNPCFYTDLPNGLKTPSEYIGGKCSTYNPTISGSLPNDLTCKFYSSEQWNFSRIVIRDDSASGMSGVEFKSYVSGSICYEIATPTTTDLPDGEPIIAFNGVNNVWNDSGDTTVEYKKKQSD